MKNLSRKIILSVLFLLPAIAGLYGQTKEKAAARGKLFPKETVRNNTKLKEGDCKGINLIMISINDIGTEHMSLYGYKRKTTPNIDKWSEGAIVFEKVFSPVSWTLPGITSVFTSLQPYAHGVMARYHNNLLNPGIETLPGLLKDNNYETAAFTGGLDNMKIFGHMRGFKVTDNNPPFTSFEVTLGQASKWLDKNSNKKFFLFIQGYDAHPPFNPPREFKGTFSSPKSKDVTVNDLLVYRGYYKKLGNQYIVYPRSGNPQRFPYVQEVVFTQNDIDYLRDSYDEEVLLVDNQVGKFLNSLDKKILDNTVVVVFSEHGEMFAKHGHFARAGPKRGTLYDEVIHVPLIIKVPRQEGRRVEGLVQLIDIMPTLLDILGIRNPIPMQGKSLLPLVNNGKPVNDFVYAGTPYNILRSPDDGVFRPESINESIRSNDWKFIHEIVFLEPKGAKDPPEEIFELYNLKDDPSELNNVIEHYPDKAKELKERLATWVNATYSYTFNTGGTHEFSDELVDEARKHGYW